MNPVRNSSIRRPLVASIVLVASLLVSSPATRAADFPALIDLGPDSGLPDPVTAAACLVGETRAAEFIYVGVLSVGDNHYTLVEPGTCTACTQGMLLLHNAQFRARQINTVPCPVTVETSVVGASLVDGCYAPDTTRVLCPPTASTHQFTNVIQAYSLPLTTGCCIDQPAYVRIRVLDNQCPLLDPADPASSQYPAPGIVNSVCVPCRTYFHWNRDGVMYEGCSVRYNANDAISVEADCCDVTPAVSRSWGSIKSQYR